VDKEKAIVKPGNKGSNSFQQELPPIPNEASESEAEHTAEVTVSCSGVCVFIDELAWEQELGDDYSEEKVQERRSKLLRQNDVNKVEEVLQNLKLPEGMSQGKQRQQLIVKVKRYLFDSPGIRFTPTNVKAWKRLAGGRGTVADAQFIIHEIAEIRELERIQEKTGFDFMGTDWEKMNRRQKGQWESDFQAYYMQAHSKALEHEYHFIAEQVFDLTNGGISIPFPLAASVAPTRRRVEAHQYMFVDGVRLQDHHHFPSWRQRGREMVELNTKQREKLRLHASPTLESLVQAVKQQPLI